MEFRMSILHLIYNSPYDDDISGIFLLGAVRAVQIVLLSKQSFALF